MKQNRMIELLNRLVPQEGVIEDIIEKVDLFRIAKSAPRSPQPYTPI